MIDVTTQSESRWQLKPAKGLKRLRHIVRNGSERRIVALFCWFSLSVHVGILLVSQLRLGLFQSNPIIDEWSMAADLVNDIDIGAPKDSALPNAEKAEEAAVPKNLLPQLPKKFTTEDQPVEETPAETIAKQAEAAEKKAEDEAKELASEAKDKEEQNRIKKEEALKRLAMERLRLEKKESNTLKANTKDSIARLKEQVANQLKVNSGPGGGAGVSQGKYMGSLRMAIRRHYALPEAYNLKDSNLKVVVSIEVNDVGQLVELKVAESSGDNAFDELALRAVKDAAPLPKPPPELIGRAINLNFSPKTM